MPLSHDQHADNLDTSGRAFLARVPLVLSTASAAQRPGLGGNCRPLARWQHVDLPRPDGGVIRVTGVPAQHGPDGTEHLTGEVTGSSSPARRASEATLRDGPGWRAAAYLLVKLPVTVGEMYAAFFAAAGLANLSYPFWWPLFRNHPANVRLQPVPALTPFGSLHIATFPGTYAAFAAGAAMVFRRSLGGTGGHRGGPLADARPARSGPACPAGRRPRAGLAALTPRERDVLALMAEGRSNAGIAASLVVSAGVVEKHVASIFSKLNLPPSEADNRRVLAVLRYLGS